MVHGPHFACVWCGDSRVYLRRGAELSQVSRDHSEVQELIERGVLDKEEARVWPRRNVVTRALGVADQPELEIVDGRAHAGDRFLLCSDGSDVHLADDEIADLLAAEDPREGPRRPARADIAARGERQCFAHCRRLRASRDDSRPDNATRLKIVARDAEKMARR